MKNFIFLVKAIYSCSLATSNRTKKSNKPIKGSLAIPQFIASLLIFVVFGSLFINALTTYRSLEADNLIIEKFLQTSLSFSIIYCFFFALGYIPQIYFDPKSDFLLALPISGTRLFLARGCLNVIFSFLYGGNLILAQLLACCFVLKLPWYSYIMAIAIFLSLILTISFLAFIIANLFSLIKSFSANKTYASMFSMVCFLIGAFSLAMVSITTPSVDYELTNTENLANVMSELNTYYKFSLIINWSGIIPSKSMLLYNSSYYWNWLYGFMIDVVVIICGIILSNKLYIKNLNNSAKKNKKQLKGRDFERKIDISFKQRKELTIYLKREFNLLKANPSSLISCLITLISTLATISVSICLTYFVSTKDNNISPIIEMVCSMLWIICIFNPFSSYINLSLEGSSFAYLKTLPINRQKYIISKMIPGGLINLIASIVVSIVFSSIFRFPILNLIFLTILTVIISQASNVFSFYCGCKFVNFNMQSSADIQKGMGALAITFLSLIFPIVSWGLTLLFYFINPSLFYIGYIISSFIYIGIGILFYKMSFNKVKFLFEMDI